jgi:hypothetical protein
MTGDDQASEVEAVRGRLIERVHDHIREATTMSDMRATERLLAVISERTARAAIAVHESDGSKASVATVNDDLAAVAEAVIELRRRGDIIVRLHDLHTVLRHVNEGEVVDLEAWRRLDRAQ